MRKSRKWSTEIGKYTSDDIIKKRCCGLAGMTIDILIDTHLTLCDHCVGSCITRARTMMMTSIELTIPDQYTIAREQ
jgi:hypothetical protein